MLSIQKQITALLIFLIVALLIVGIGAMLLDVPKYYSLVNNARLTTGTVISKEPENHMAIQYEYEANGQRYTSKGRAEDIGKSFETIEIKESVPVYYDMSNPSSASLGEPNRYLSSSLRGTVFISICVALFFFLYVIKIALRR
jgi:hypothetical protein